MRSKEATLAHTVIFETGYIINNK